MATPGPLSQLYNDVYPKIGNRVWTHENVQKANNLKRRIEYLNETRSLRQALQPLEQHHISEEQFGNITRMTAKDAISRETELKTRLTEYGSETEYEALDLFGKLHTRTLPQVADGEYLALVLQSYFRIATSLGANDSQMNNSRLLYYVQAEKMPHNLEENPCYHHTTAYSFWKRRWLHGDFDANGEVWVRTGVSLKPGGDPHGFKKMEDLKPKELMEEERVLSQWRKTRERLTHAIMKHAELLKDVDQIICFGLGSLEWKYPKRFVQHSAALAIRNALQEVRTTRGISGTIPILAQDPLYCSNCKEVLQKELGIKAVTEFEGFMSVTRKSFAVSIVAGAPICQVIADLTLDVGGPAALLFEQFSDDYLAQEREPTAESGYTSNEPTRNTVDYKKRCIEEDISDVTDALGMSIEEMEKTYPLPAAIRQGWRKNAKPSEKDLKWFNDCKEMHIREAKINFKGSTVFIRKDRRLGYIFVVSI